MVPEWAKDQSIEEYLGGLRQTGINHELSMELQSQLDQSLVYDCKTWVFFEHVVSELKMAGTGPYTSAAILINILKNTTPLS